MTPRVKLYGKHGIQGHVAGTGKMPVPMEHSHPDDNSNLVEEKGEDARQWNIHSQERV